MCMLKRSGTLRQATPYSIPYLPAAVNRTARKKNQKFFENLLTKPLKCGIIVTPNSVTTHSSGAAVGSSAKKDFSIFIRHPVSPEDDVKITRQLSSTSLCRLFRRKNRQKSSFASERVFSCTAVVERVHWQLYNHDSHKRDGASVCFLWMQENVQS